MLTKCTLRITAAGSAKVEVNDQQIQTEIVETEHKSVQVGSMTKQQGEYISVQYNEIISLDFLHGLVIFCSCFSMASNNIV